MEVDERMFVVGCPRSGTTVLQRFIAANSRITSFPETDFFAKLVGGKKGRALARLGLVRGYRYRRARAKLSRALDLPEPRCPVPAFGRLSDMVTGYVSELDELALDSGKQKWLEKTPRHYRYLSLICTHVPEARIIHIVRDGRAVVGSILDRARQYPENFGEEYDVKAAVRLWNEAVRSTAARMLRHEDRIVSYERLCLEPVDVLSRLSDWLGVPYEANMAAAGSTDSIRAPEERWKDGAEAGVQAAASKFDAALSEADQRWALKRLDWSTYERVLQYTV